MNMVVARLGVGLFAIACLATVGTLPSYTGESKKPTFQVKIQDDKTVVVDMEDSGAIDPTKRINFGSQGNFYMNISTLQNQTLHLSHFPSFMINGRLMQQGNGGRFEAVNQPLPKGPAGKQRQGTFTVWSFDNIRVTQTMELHPSKSKGAGKKRELNNVLITYLVENKGNQNANFGLRTYMDTYVIDNDGCLFAAPVTHPKQILNGVVLEGKTLPPYVQMLQRPDLANPGYVAHLTLNLGSKIEKANKVVLTRHGAGFGGWDMPAMQSMGDSGMGIFWPIKEIKPGAKRELGYVYGGGIAVAPESEGRFVVALSGSFEPGKIFTVSATVADPSLGQTLTLELPPGMERIEGKEVQPVAPLDEGQEYGTVLWKCRVTKTGNHTLRLRSSTGVTQSKIVSVTAAN